MRGTGFVGLTDATIAQDTMTEIRDIEETGGMTTEMDIEETIGQGQGPPEGGLDPGRWIMGDGDVLKTGRGMRVMLTSDDGQITEEYI